MPKTTHSHLEGLRPRHCCEPTCRAVFSVCASCDRGRRYCSEACRRRRRRAQTKAAGRRYQASAAGRQAHCCRQQTYRERQSRPPVTHQALAPAITTTNPSRSPLAKCAICGLSNPWSNPFHRMVPRRRHRTRSAKVQTSTFSDGR